MGPADAVRSVLGNYANFRGRARRSEYWWFAVVVWVVSFALGVITVASRGPGIVLLAVWCVFLVIPSLAVLIRRLHDTGRSGAWWLITFVPFGGIVLFVFTCLDSQPGTNDWGTSGKYPGGRYPPSGPYGPGTYRRPGSHL